MKKAVMAVLSALFVLTVCGSAMAKKKVLYIDSYHQGYAWSDGITEGVREGLKGKDVDLKVIRMDTKRNTSEPFKKQAAVKAKAEIEAFKPDVVIASDDNASKYLIMAYYRDAALPFVFCGLNWDEKVYGLPYKNVTGMVEVTPVPQLIDQLKPLAKGSRIGFLAPDTITSKKEATQYNEVFGMNTTDYYAKDYEDWKKGFVEIQKKVDILIIASDGGLYNDHRPEYEAFVLAHTKIPTGSCYDFMAPVAILNYAKVAAEQGYWGATAALKILDGTPPSAIPIVKNKEGKLVVNVKIAEASGIEIPYEVIASADEIIR
ncbi:MAG: ABC transporter substrate binding protein [Thermodesulfobacteriota bacterium]|nr:ABC transporter substrate binding protein [Thermodesulfobacteriota bacterium]